MALRDIWVIPKAFVVGLVKVMRHVVIFLAKALSLAVRRTIAVVVIVLMVVLLGLLTLILLAIAAVLAEGGDTRLVYWISDGWDKLCIVFVTIGNWAEIDDGREAHNG